MTEEITELKAMLIEQMQKLNDLCAKLTEQRESTKPATRGIPETVRIPKNGERCPYSGLSRSAIYRLIKAKKIRVKIHKDNPFATRGTPLIIGSSLQAYLTRLPTLN